MILVADSGSTKTNWALIDRVGFRYINSEGYNPYYMDSAYIQDSIMHTFNDSATREKIKQIYFYGAGCSLASKHIVENALGNSFQNAEIVVESDLLASARCLLGNEAGFAAILGTGTNTCFYNGKHIVEVVDSLGFLAGDEGSGAYLGKQIIKAYIRKSMPNHLNSLFEETFKVTSEQIISELYATSSPNKFVASFATFAGQNIEDDFIYELVKSSFKDFFAQIIVHYKNYRGMCISFVGSVAFSFLPILQAVTEEFDMTLGKVIKNPLEDLVAYHLANSTTTL